MDRPKIKFEDLDDNYRRFIQKRLEFFVGILRQRDIIEDGQLSNDEIIKIITERYNDGHFKVEYILDDDNFMFWVWDDDEKKYLHLGYVSDYKEPVIFLSLFELLSGDDQGLHMEKLKNPEHLCVVVLLDVEDKGPWTKMSGMSKIVKKLKEWGAKSVLFKVSD